MGPLVPFEKFDLACMLYERVLNKDSFQLIVNTFPDPQERDNLIHRLGLDKSKHSKGAPSLTTNCALLPMSPIKGPVAPLPISPRADDDAAAAAAAAGAEEETGEVFAVPT